MDSWTKSDGKTYGLGETLQAGASWERRSPHRTAELVGDVLVPLTQATVTGLVGCVAGVLVGGSPGAGVIGGVAVFGLSWLVLLVDHRNALWVIERVIGADLDGDQVVGGHPDVHDRAQTEPTTVRVELAEVHPGGSRTRFLDLPVTDAKLRDVARAVQGGASFSRRGLADALSQNEYEKLSGAMLKAGLLVDVGGNKRVLSAAGRVLLRKVAGAE